MIDFISIINHISHLTKVAYSQLVKRLLSFNSGTSKNLACIAANYSVEKRRSSVSINTEWREVAKSASKQPPQHLM